ncbi:MAG: helix-turn-helix domain containing protein [Acidobacteria bacterium]|nr:helix-turn-helix domain containing protein [Acidobacteriota bacterium]
MPILTRKQRELAQRENLVLETARRLLLENGYSGLTMERIAEAAEYSKGTIYNHFPCKEEVVAELACRVLHGKAVFVERAAVSRGRSRERMAAIGEAAMLFVRLYPEDMRIMQVLQSQVLMRKVSQKQRDRVLAQERRVLNAITGVVRDALAQGDLPAEKFSGPLSEELAFGICCAIDGGHSVMSRHAPLEDLGPRDPHQAIARMLDLLADGCGWRPLSSEMDFDKVRERVRTTVFEEEARRLQRAPRPR